MKRYTVSVESGFDPLTGEFYPANEKTVNAENRSLAINTALREGLATNGRRLHVYDADGTEVFANC